MPTVLLTGGAGYIGSHTLVEMIDAGYDCVVLDNFSNSSPKSLKRVAQICGKEFPWYTCDIRDEEGLDSIFSSNKIDAVIHFAGLKAVGESVEKPDLYFDNNVNGTNVLLKVMQKHNVKQFVFSSSATVYGDPERLPLDETCALHTTNPYGETKLQIENNLRAVYEKDNSWKVVILRYFNPVGAHESGLIGESPNGIPNNLTPYISQVAQGLLPYLRVFGNDYPTPDGTGIRDYIHVVDLAKGHLCALEKTADQGLFIYNLGTGTGYSVFDVLHAYEKACGKEIPYKILPRRAGDVAEMYASCKKANEELGWFAKLTLDDMCRDLYNWQSKNPYGYGEGK